MPEIKTKVLFVCMGNICRSPTAEGIFTKLAADHDLLETIMIDSAGTHGYHEGHSPDQRSQQTAKQHGIDISMLRARLVDHDDFLEFDYILAMDESNLGTLLAMCPESHKHKVKLMLDYHPDPEHKEVPDPYYGPGDGFKHVFDLLDKAAAELLAEIKKSL